MFKLVKVFFFFFSSRRRHTRLVSDWSSDVCSSDLAARCHGLLEASRGNEREAFDALEAAVRHHARASQSFDLARTLLVRGEIERRFKARKKARASLETADATFGDLGAIRWSERARDAIARLGRVVGSRELTPTERRVAELIIDRKTNREIADSLFLSIK